MAAGDLEAAVEAFSAALDLYPDYMTARRNRATAYREMGRDADADADNDVAIRLKSAPQKGSPSYFRHGLGGGIIGAITGPFAGLIIGVALGDVYLGIGGIVYGPFIGGLLGIIAGVWLAGFRRNKA